MFLFNVLVRKIPVIDTVGRPDHQVEIVVLIGASSLAGNKMVFVENSNRIEEKFVLFQLPHIFTFSTVFQYSPGHAIVEVQKTIGIDIEVHELYVFARAFPRPVNLEQEFSGGIENKNRLRLSVEDIKITRKKNLV